MLRVPPRADSRETDERWWVRAVRRPSLPGVALGLLWLFESWEPSLLVRGWLLQGVVGGLTYVVGYVLGRLLGRLTRWILGRLDRSPTPLDAGTDLRLRAWFGLAVLVLGAWAARTEVSEHRWTWERLGYDPSSAWLVYGGTIAVTVAVAVLLLVLGAGLGLVQRRLARLGHRWLPAWIAGSIALVVLTWAVLAALNNYVLQRSLDGFNATFAASDRDLDGAPAPPTSKVRSGGPDSEVEWDETGREGRRFLTRGPTASAIGEVAPGEAEEPVRVFVGRSAGDEVEDRVALAMAELERFDAFSRAVVLVVVPTGTGWVNEQIVQPVEYLHAGDVATVAVQYSHMPSPLAFLAEGEAAGSTGDALVAAVRARIDRLPEAERPRLLVAGESLGSFGASQAFSSLDDLLARTDASLWVGPPETMHLRREAERVRRAGSPQIKPVVGDGQDVVFANRDSDLDGTRPRTVFLQHADDPIVWWDWGTTVDEPDWLDEPLDPAVNPAMSWTPLTTFLNLAVDMGVSNDFDEDHGHLYGTQPLTAWRAMLAPKAWDDTRVEELRDRLTSIAR
jgi:uncharacterized membrane protein